MNQEDLMIGDWFRFRYTIDGEETVHTFRITLPRRDRGCVWGDDGTGSRCICKPEQLEPISITPEILEKSGFQCRELGCWSFITRFVNIRIKRAVKWHIIIRKKDENDKSEQVSYYRDWAESVYVHELQHALRLCEINKEIVL